ncbi:InlB B-repeat-containing protein [Bifidobacterium sp. W8114]|nr:InlB B-repeat-containing protein [Bifidobacterium sp. W8114]
MIFGGLTAADAIANPISPAQQTDASVSTTTTRAQPGSTSYQVVFDSAEGSSVDSQNVKDGALASRPEQDPTRDGYLFDGWFAKDANGDSKVAYDFTQPVTTDLTLTAHWTKGTSAWSLSPASGKTRGYAKITLTPPTKPDIRFSHIIPAKEEGSQAIASDGNLYRWGDNNYKLETPEDEKRTPSLVNPPTGVHFTQVSTGYSHFLAIGSDGNLYSWGHNADGELGRETVSTTPKDNPQIDNQPRLVTPPAGVHFTQACAGKWHSLALGSDGNLYSWGQNKYGELGRDTGSAIYDVKPGKVNLPKGITKITQISAGTFYSMALDSDGDLYSWGDNTYDELGRYAGGYPFRDRSPRKMIMPAGVKKFTWIKAGEWTSLATSSDGSLYSWGWNEYGQLGRNTAPARQDRTPRKVTMPAGVTKFTQVSTEHRHSLALGSDGNLYSWGLNDCEQLGRDTGSAKYDVKPGKVPTPAGAAQFTEVSAGYSHSLAIGSDGNLYSWGQNKYGELGRPTSGKYDSSPGMVAFPEDPKPVNVSFGGAPGTNLDPNSDGTWSVTTPPHDHGRVDTVITWRMNGERPDAHLSYRYLGNYLIVFDPDGGNGFGFQIVTEGNRLKPPAKDPTKNKHLFDGWFIGDTAYDFSRPVTDKATLTAHWSSADSNRWKLDKDNGPETGGQTVTLTPPPERGIRLSQADAGDLHSGAVGSDGSLYTWGDNDSHGQLGRDTTDKQDSRPGKADAPAGVKFVYVSAGYGFSVALGSDGNLYSWGDNSRGQLGRTVTSSTPANRPNKVETPAGITFVQASAGGSYVVAASSDGDIYTWGNNIHGELGRSTTSDNPADKPGKANTPADVTFASVSAGWDHTVAVDTQGAIYTWGDNNHGELGRSTTKTPADKPGKADTPTGVTFTQASAGGSHSVAVSDDGSLYTWGYAANGRLGRDTNNTPTDKPGKVGTPAGITFTQASAGDGHSIALGSDGSLYTWGDSSKTPSDRPNKVDTPAGITFTQASAGASYCLALGSDGNLYSWGDNTNGQLGRDTGSTQAVSPAKDDFPELGIPTHVLFDNAEASNLIRKPDGTWTATTPAHMPGTSTVTIDWRLNGAAQTPDTSNMYRYNSISLLPRAGGGGLLPLLIAGLIAFACAAAARRHRLENLSRQQ